MNDSSRNSVLSSRFAVQDLRLQAFPLINVLLKPRLTSRISGSLRDPFVAIDTGLSVFYRLIVHFRRDAFCAVRSIKSKLWQLRHSCELLSFMRRHSFCAIVRRDEPSNFCGVSISPNTFSIQFFNGFDLTDHLRPPLMRHMASGTGGTNAATVVVVDVSIYLIHRVAHFMAANTNLRCWGHSFHLRYWKPPQKMMPPIKPINSSVLQRRGWLRHHRQIAAFIQPFTVRIFSIMTPFPVTLRGG